MDFIDALDDEMLCSFIATRVMALTDGEAHACSSAPLRVQRAPPGSTAVRDFLTSQDPRVLQLPVRELADLHPLLWSLVELLVDHSAAEEASPLDRVLLHAEVLKRVLIAKRRSEVQAKARARAPPPAAHSRRRSTVTAAFGKRVSILEATDDSGIAAADQSTDEVLSMDDFRRSVALATDTTGEDLPDVVGPSDPQEHSGQADPFTLSRIGVDVPRRNSHMFGSSPPSGQPTPRHHQAETLSKSLGLDAGRIREAMRTARKNSHSRDAAAVVMVDAAQKHVIGLMPHVILRAIDRPAYSSRDGAFCGPPDAEASMNASPTSGGALWGQQQQQQQGTPPHLNGSGGSPLSGGIVPTSSPRGDKAGTSSPHQSPTHRDVLGEPAVEDQGHRHVGDASPDAPADPFKSPPRSGIAVNTELSRNVHRFPMPPPRLPRDDTSHRIETEASFDDVAVRRERTRDSYDKIESRIAEPEGERVARLQRELARRERTRADVTAAHGRDEGPVSGATFSVRGTWSASGSPRIVNVEHPSSVRDSALNVPLATPCEDTAASPPHASSTLRLEPFSPLRPSVADGGGGVRSMDVALSGLGCAALCATGTANRDGLGDRPQSSRPAWSAGRQERRFDLVPPDASQDRDGRAIDMVTKRKDYVFKRCRISTHVAVDVAADGQDALEGPTRCRSDKQSQPQQQAPLDAKDGSNVPPAQPYRSGPTLVGRADAGPPEWTAEQRQQHPPNGIGTPGDAPPRNEDVTVSAPVTPQRADGPIAAKSTPSPRVRQTVGAPLESRKGLRASTACRAASMGRPTPATSSATRQVRRPLAAPSTARERLSRPNGHPAASGPQRSPSSPRTSKDAASSATPPSSSREAAAAATPTTQQGQPSSAGGPLSPSKPPTPKKHPATDAPVRLPSADRRSRPQSSGPGYRTALIPAEMLGFATTAPSQGPASQRLPQGGHAVGAVAPTRATTHGAVRAAGARAASAPTSRPDRGVVLGAGQRQPVAAIALHEHQALKSAGPGLWPRRTIHSAGPRVSGPQAFMHDMDTVRRSIRRTSETERAENATPDASFFSDGSPLKLDMEPALVCGESSASGGGAALSSVMWDRRADGGAAHSMASEEAASLHNTVIAWNKAAMGLMRVQ